MAVKIVATTEEFEALVTEVTLQPGYKEPIAFAIAKIDRGWRSPKKILQVSFPVVNWNENHGSAVMFIKVLQKSGVDVDFSRSEFVATINEVFINNALAMFTPYLEDTRDDTYRNIQVIKTLANIKNIGNDFSIVFLFKNEKKMIRRRSLVEALYTFSKQNRV